MKSPRDATHLTQLIPLIAGGIIIILCISIVASYIHFSSIPPVVILPGGVTYTGK